MSRRGQQDTSWRKSQDHIDMRSLFPARIDTSEESFLELYRQCDIDARTTVLVLMQALANPSALNWLQAGNAITEHVARLDGGRDGLTQP